MYEKIKIKSDRGTEAIINVVYFKIVKIDEQTYLKCILNDSYLYVPFDKVIEIIS